MEKPGCVEAKKGKISPRVVLPEVGIATSPVVFEMYSGVLGTVVVDRVSQFRVQGTFWKSDNADLG